MPPKSRDRETEAVEAEEAKASKRSRELFDAALDARLVSRVRPSSLTELKPSKVLKRSDCKDIHKRSSVKKSRYMTVFPGQLGNLKEGRLGSLAKLDTQNPVMYIEYPGFGRLKLCGTIVRSRATRYFTLNVKSKDRLNLEDWFDSMIVFSTCFWVGTAETNPGEEPMPFPEELKHVQTAAEADQPPPATPADFAFSVAAEEGAAPKKSAVSADHRERDGAKNDEGQTRDKARRATVSLDQISDEDVDEDDRAARSPAADASRPSARPRRESAKAARYDFSEVDDFDLEEEEEEEEKVFRGRVTATVAKEAAPLAAPKRRSVGAAGAGAAKKAKSNSPAEPAPKPAAVFLQTGHSASPPEVVAISDDDGDEPPERGPAAGGKQTSLLGFLGGKKEAAAAAAPRRASAGAPRAAAAAPKPSKKFVLDSDSDSESEEEEEEEDSDFEA
jgi:hypothetical protein